MIYDILNILKVAIVIWALFNWTDIIHRVKRKRFIPPNVKTKKIIGFYGWLAATCFILGCIANNIFTKETPHGLSSIISIGCCLGVFIASLQFLQVAKEPIVVSKDIKI